MVDQSNEAFDRVKSLIVRDFGGKIHSRGKEVVKRCHICGDSRDPRDAHMYIGMKNSAIVYHCFKCDAGGLVDGKFFRDIQVYDPDLIILCNKQNDEYYTRTKYVQSRYTIRNPYIGVDTSRKQTMEKLEYINDRLGMSLTVAEVCNKRIILNLHDFLCSNKIGMITRREEEINQLDRWFVGFLSIDNKFINMRRIDNDTQRLFTTDRYVNYNIYDEIDNTKRYYILPTVIDITKPIDVYIAEGPLDILSIQSREQPPNGNRLFISIGGKAYLGAIKYLLLDYGFISMNLHIYPDGDIKNYTMDWIKKEIIPYRHSLYIHRNVMSGEKDFGVPGNRITESETKIL